MRHKTRLAEDILHGLRELAQAMDEGVPLEQRFTVRTVSIPQPHKTAGWQSINTAEVGFKCRQILGPYVYNSGHVGGS